MAVRYKTVLEEAEEMIVIEKSRFIGYIKPVETVEEAEAFVASIRTANRDATHNVPVYVLGEKYDVQKYSDDGEPSGTAGVPVLQMLMKEGITNVAIVMTRYFGGIKLGTGGLVRAYTGIAKEALRAAGVAEVKDMDVVLLEIQYTYHGKAENMALKGDFIIRNTIFTDKVTLEIVCDPTKTEEIIKSFMEVTAGTVKVVEQRQELEKVRVGY
ncbi:MAG: YigZ family protein [Firmicutes bacterium]|nr:YigZ family protein [Clostridiales bacterium]MBQ4340054.1 YigZ family protein [Bacillota bacterium]